MAIMAININKNMAARQWRNGVINGCGCGI
jgi:hypothetical protein